MLRSIANDIRMQIRGGSTLSRLLIINVAVFILLNILYRLVLLILGYREPMLGITYRVTEYWLGFPYDPGLMLTRPWTLLTSLFVHSGFGHILWNMLSLYWFGSIFSEFTRKKLGWLYFTGGIFSLFISWLGYSLMNDSFSGNGYIIGASGAVMAVVSATAFLVPEYSMNLLFIGPVRIKYIALVMILLDLLGVTYMDNTGGHFAHLGGALFGFLFVMGMKGKIPFPQRSSLRVIRNTPKKEGLSRKDAQRRIDEILDKINRSGYDSLSKEEKEDWFKLSNKV